MRGTDIRVLYPPRARPPHGHDAPGTGSSGFSASLVSLSAIHEPSLDDSNGHADSKVDAHPPCPIQIGVCPQSRQTPDLGTPAPQLTAIGHTQDCAATVTAAVIPPHFLDAENVFLNRKEAPTHSSWASCSEPPAHKHNTNAAADLSTCNDTSATLGQHNACPDRDDTERTRPVTTPSVPLSYDLRHAFVPFEHAYAIYDASLTYVSDDVVLFWHPPSVFSRWTLSPFTVDLVQYNCADSSCWPRKPAYLAMIRRSQSSLLQMTPESKNVSAVMYATSITISGSKNAKIQPSEATWQNSPKTRKCARSLRTLCSRRLAEASPHDKLWGIGLSACNPESTNASTVVCATLATTSCKKIANISSREATLRHSHKNMRYALPLDILANAASPKLAPMINCGVPA